jgi:hypothetical protein
MLKLSVLSALSGSVLSSFGSDAGFSVGVSAVAEFSQTNPRNRHTTNLMGRKVEQI